MAGEKETAEALRNVAEIQKTMTSMLHDTMTEVLALRAVCSGLIAEVALAHPDPQHKFNQIITGLRGAAEAVSAATKKPGLEAAMEDVLSMAEMLFPGAPKNTQ